MSDHTDVADGGPAADGAADADTDPTEVTGTSEAGTPEAGTSEGIDVIDLTAGDPPMRLERDALGPLAIPADASFGIHTARAVAALAISTMRLSDYPDLVSALGAVKQAAARANLDAGVLVAPHAKAIDEAAQLLTYDAPAVRSSLIADPLAGGGSIGVHMNVNEVIANMANLGLGHPFGAYAPIRPKQHVGASQSTADVCHTASRLAVVAGIELLERVVADLVEALRERAQRFASATTLARTCLQDAMPVPADLLFAGTAAALVRRLDAIAHTASPLAGVVLGGTVVGTGAGAPERYRERVVPHLCEITGRNLFLHGDRASALQHSDDLVAVSAEIVAIATVTMKLAQDLRLLSSGPVGGFGEVVLPHVIEGSSFFGDKRNPAVAESMISAGVQVLGHDAAVRGAAAHAELHLNVFDHIAVVNTLDALSLLTEAIERFNHGCVMGIELDEHRLADLVDRHHREGAPPAAEFPESPESPDASESPDALESLESLAPVAPRSAPVAPRSATDGAPGAPPAERPEPADAEDTRP